MATCHKCHRQFRGEELYCEPCEEYKRQVRMEIEGILCIHCGQTFMPGEFDRHNWLVYYRDGQHPRGKRVRL